MALFGPTTLALRWVSAAIGTATLATTYVLVRRMFNRRVALLATGWLMFSLWHVIFSRTGLRAVSLPLFEAAALYCMWRGLELSGTCVSSSRQVRRWRLVWCALAGLLFGLAMYTYTAARFLVLVPVLFAASQMLVSGQGRRSTSVGALVLISALALASLPLVAYFVQYPHDFFERPSQVSVLSERASFSGPVDALLYSAQKTAGLFGWEGDRNWDRNIAGRPALDPVSFVLFVAGLAIAVAGWRRPGPRLALLVLLVMLLPHVLTVANIPNYLRAIGTLPALFVFPAVALDRGIRWGSGRLAVTNTRVLKALVLLGLVAGAARTGYDYFVDWSRHPLVLSEFDGQRVAGVRYALEQETDCATPVYVMLPNGDLLGSMTQSTLYSVPQRLHRCHRLFGFYGREGLVLPPDGEPAALYVLPGDASLPVDQKQSFLKDAQVLGSNEDFSVLKLSGQPSIHPEHAASFSFGSVLTLTGFDLPRQAKAGDILAPRLYWKVDQAVNTELKLGVHLVDGNQQAVAKSDSAGLDISSRCHGESIATWLGPQAPETLPSGGYSLLISLYEVPNMERLPITDAASRPVGGSLLLGPFKVRGTSQAQEPAYPSGASFGDFARLVGYDLDWGASGGRWTGSGDAALAGEGAAGERLHGVRASAGCRWTHDRPA
ncbi:MAG: glycosyltransferase family 39 protein [Chloroflexi bacterium]|nr:glycosyltransferase family 39 protein [Chloroflexota bacterium]